MEVHMKENGNMVDHMDMVYINMPMATFIKVFLMIHLMAQGTDA